MSDDCFARRRHARAQSRPLHPGATRAGLGLFRDRHQRVRADRAAAEPDRRAGDQRAAGRPHHQRLCVRRGGRRAATGDHLRAVAAQADVAGVAGAVRGRQRRYRIGAGLPQHGRGALRRRPAAWRILRRGGVGGGGDHPCAESRQGGRAGVFRVDPSPCCSATRWRPG